MRATFIHTPSENRSVYIDSRTTHQNTVRETLDMCDMEIYSEESPKMTLQLRVMPEYTSQAERPPQTEIVLETGRLDRFQRVAPRKSQVTVGAAAGDSTGAETTENA